MTSRRRKQGRSNNAVATMQRPQEQRRQPNIRPGGQNFRPISDSIIAAMYQNMGPQAQVDAMYAPGAPLRPMPGLVPQTGIRGWDYSVGYNIGRLPRSTELYSFNDLRAMASSYYGIGMCEQVWFDYIAQLELDIQPRKDLIPEDGDISQYESDIEGYKQFFAYPDHDHDLHSWLQMAVKEQLEIDALAIYLRRDRAGRLYSLDLIDSSMLSPLVDDRGRKPQSPFPAFEQFVHGIPAALLTSEDLIYVKETERTNSVYGLSRVERIILNINVALRKQTKDLAHFTDGNLPPGFIQPSMDVQWSQEEIEAWEMSLNNLLAGNDELRARLKVLPRGFEYKAITELDDLHVDLDRFILNITAACYGLTMAELAFTEDVNRASGDSQENVVYRRAMGPLMKRYARLFTMILQKYFKEQRFVVSFKGYEESDDILSHAQAYTQLTSAGILGLTDAAKLMKLPEPDDAPYIGRTFLTPDGPIFLDDMASSTMRDAAMKAKLAGFDMAANPSLQPGAAPEEEGNASSGEENSGEGGQGSTSEEASSGTALSRLTASVEALLLRLNQAESSNGPVVAQPHTGIMAAFLLDPATAAQLSLPDGEPARDLHISLCMLGDTREFTGNVEALKEVIANFAYSARPVEGAISGVGRFNTNADGMTPIYASVNVHHLHHVREQLVHALELVGYEIDHTYAWTPHITLAYIPDDAPMPVSEVPPLPLCFDTVWLCIGDERYPFEFGEMPGLEEEDEELDVQEERLLNFVLHEDEYHLIVERDWAAFDAKRVPKGRTKKTMTEQQQDQLNAQVEAQMDQIKQQSTPEDKAEAKQDRAEARAARKVAAAQARLAHSEAKMQKALAKEEKVEARAAVQAARLALKLARIKLATLKLQMRLQKMKAAAAAKAAKMAAAAQKKATASAARAAKAASKAARAQARAAKSQARAAAKLQSFVHAISAQATRYLAMASRPLSKHWTSADAQEAQTIATDLSNLMEMVASHGSESDAMSLLNDVTQSISELQGQHGLSPARASALGALVAHIQSSLGRVTGIDEDEDEWASLIEYSEEERYEDDQSTQQGEAGPATNGQGHEVDRDTQEEEERRYTISELVRLLENTTPTRETPEATRAIAPGEAESRQRSITDDYRNWRARAIDDVRAGRPLRGFTTTLIPEHMHAWMSDQLEQCESVEAVKQVFARAKDEEHWQDNNDGLQHYLATLPAQGVETITWHSYPGACPECAQNDGQTVKTGQRFRSGAYLPPGHNRCVCRWTDNRGRRYEWTGVDGEYRQLAEEEK